MSIAINRRSFLKKVSAATAAAAVTPAVVSLTPQKIAAAPSPLNKWPGRCVVNFNNDASDGPTANQTVCKKMADDALKLLTGEDTVGAAWKAVFPSALSQDSKIAIKINLLNPEVPPHPYVVMGITEGLTQMEVGGAAFPAGNIYIYDSNNGSSMDATGFTATRFPGITRRKDSYTATGGARGKNYASTLAACDYLINVPNMRGHWSSYGSVTLGFKSHFGTYDVNGHSDNHAYLRDINCTGPVYDKTVLTVGASIFGLRLGHGPTGSADDYSTYTKYLDPEATNASPSTVLVSTDPCTAEFQLIKGMRINAGQAYTQASMPDYLKASSGVTGVLSTTLNVGVSDETEMDYREIINGVVTGDTGVNGRMAVPVPAIGSLRVTPNPIKKYAGIDFTVPEYYVDKVAHIRIFDTRGSLVRSLETPVRGARNRITWDARDHQGRKAAAGRYIIRFNAGRYSQIQKLVVL